jgi:transcriptional regulator with XRE-family HTH domain
MRKNEQQHVNRVLKALGDAIRNRRIELLLTQEEVGLASELHRTYVTDVENGLRNLSFLTLLRLARALQCSLSQLMIETEILDGVGRKKRRKATVRS